VLTEKLKKLSSYVDYPTQRGENANLYL
jgi:hypothetical protein